MADYVVTVWDIETGEIERKLWDATMEELEEIEDEFHDDPRYIVEADFK